MSYPTVTVTAQIEGLGHNIEITRVLHPSVTRNVAKTLEAAAEAVVAQATAAIRTPSP